MSLYYKQASIEGNISIERHTENTPQDKKYYVFKKGEIVYKSASFKKAQAKYNELKPKPKKEDANKEYDKKKRISNAIAEQTAFEKELYWHYSHQFRSGKPKR